MKRIIPALLLATITVFAGCGKSEADKVLDRTHAALGKQIMESVHLTERPLLGTLEHDWNIKANNIGETIKGNASLDFSLKGKYDVRNQRDPLIDATLNFDGSMSQPASGEIPANTTALKGSVLMRIASKALAISIPSFRADMSTLGAPFMMPAANVANWYGAELSQINTLIRQSAEQRGEVPVDLEETIGNFLSGNRVSPRAVGKLWDGLHIWRGVEVVKEDATETQVRVTTDPEKLKGSVNAIIGYLRETAGPSWSRIEEDPTYGPQLQELMREGGELDKFANSVEGVLTVDTGTALPRAFSGSIYSVSGALLATLSVEKKGESDFSVLMTKTDAPNSPLSIRKEGEFVTVLSGTKEILKGTISKTRATFTIYEKDSDAVRYSGDIAIKQVSKDGISLGKSVISWPKTKTVVTIESLDFEQKVGSKDSSMFVNLHADIEGVKNALQVTGSTIRKETTPFMLSVPSYLSFDQLRSDLTSALMESTMQGNESMKK